MSVLALLVYIPLGDWLEKLPKAKQQIPKPYTEETRLPGKPPAVVKDLHGAWQLEYSAEDIQVGEQNGDLLVKMVVKFEPDGSYKLKYAARWGNPPLRGRDARGVTVEETGQYKLSSDVLILDPVEITQHDILKNDDVTNTLQLANEKHVLVVHWETKRIHLAGRCASYQVDPLCKDWQVENVWFTFKPGRYK